MSDTNNTTVSENPVNPATASVISAKFTKRAVKISNLVVDFNLNVRDKDKYDVPAMKDDIIRMGRITDPLTVMECLSGELKVLKGNRRALAGQELDADPALPNNLKEALQKVDVHIYKESDLTTEDITKLIIDQGGQKPLAKVEVLKTVWRLARQFFSEKQIGQMLYFPLADYSDNRRKLAEMPKDKIGREKFLVTWFRGTLSGYMLSVLRMPMFVQEVFIHFHELMDRKPKEGEKCLVKMTRPRVVELSKAKSKDEEEKKWDFENGGPNFLQVWEKYKKEDAGEITAEEKKRWSLADTKQKADNFKSDIVRKSLLATTGEEQRDLVDLDDEVFRLNNVKKVLAEKWDGIKDVNVKEFARLILGGKPGDVATFLSDK